MEREYAYLYTSSVLGNKKGFANWHVLSNLKLLRSLDFHIANLGKGI